MTYDHHPDPATAFCIEVDILEGLFFDMRHGMAQKEDVSYRAARAMQFKVGGNEYAVAAKNRLRELIASN